MGDHGMIEWLLYLSGYDRSVGFIVPVFLLSLSVLEYVVLVR